MNKPLFSVVIPLYNKAKYIQKTVQCVLEQTEQNFEIIVVDDGSSDEGVELVQSIHDDRIRVLRKENGGVSTARNMGIRESKGKYITFLDADDYWTNDFLSTVNELFIHFPEAKVACPSYQMIYGDRAVTPVWKSVSLTEVSLVEDIFEMATASCWIMTSSCVAVEAEALTQMDYWFPENERVYEDFDLWIRLGEKYPVAHSPKVCGGYNRITDSNARKTKKIVYSQTYMHTLKQMRDDLRRTDQQKAWIDELIDRRMVPYIISLLICREKETARRNLSLWHPNSKYNKYKFVLNVLALMPTPIVELIQNVRLKVF